jgi:UDP-glucose 4-epimerase
VVTLVTGAFGFLGGTVSAELERGGHTVARAGRPQTELRSRTFAAMVDRVDPDAVVHCAGPSSVALSVADPAADYDGSAGVLADVLALLARRSRPPRVVLLSSAAVYGDPKILPVTESAQLHPLSPYGFHRIACEVLLQEYRELHSGDAVTLRIFSAYGEGLKRQVLWDIARRAISADVVELHGTGLESRDFIHSTDVARVVRELLTTPTFAHDAVNVGTGRETTIRELAELLLRAVHSRAKLRFSGVRRPGDPVRWQADVTRLHELGINSFVSIEEGAPAYAQWVQRELCAA